MARLLAFGDSLIAGYVDHGASFFPWAPVLQEQLSAECVDHVGFSGWTTRQMCDHTDTEGRDVCDRIWPGLRHALRAAEARCGGYHVVIILVGTNDLADRVPVDTFMSQLASLHETAHDFGARTVALTIPQSAASEQVARALPPVAPGCAAPSPCGALPLWRPRACSPRLAASGAAGAVARRVAGAVQRGTTRVGQGAARARAAGRGCRACALRARPALGARRAAHEPKGLRGFRTRPRAAGGPLFT